MGEKLRRHTPIALFVGIQACVIQIIDNCLHGVLPPAVNVGFSCISFLGWATYFMAGCTIKDGIRCFAGFIVGIIASIVIMKLGGAFGILGTFATPAAILIIAWLLFYLELAPFPFNFVPAVYISAGAYFATMSYVPNATMSGMFMTEMVYLTLGLVFGWMTIAFRTWFETKRDNQK
ncbi:DUF1097 domain-containing protein [Eubacterium sp. 1001713B170207_170306_E7]|uniref:DUF1097 domain-containing protein n=1 Tax=Eubacterium sp. 1001713B170207_170306_E7 TaxID=2787097 RepID=UPI001899E994|nr:DUF1097 domain-containing protein [Eubacterium sp. 1001713B170207_170306_E7]